MTLRQTLARVGHDLTLRARARRRGALAEGYGRWTLQRTGTRLRPIRIWTGYGATVRIEPQALGEPWLVTVERPGREPERYRTRRPFDIAARAMTDWMREDTGGRAGVGRAD